jgi:integrase
LGAGSRQIKRVVKFWCAYAGDKPVTSINDAVLRDYVDWRRDYYANFEVLPKNAHLHPTDKTLLWESTLGRTLLRYATERGYRENLPMPLYPFKLKNHRVRPAFSNSEIDVLLNGIERWIEEAKNDVWQYVRVLLKNYVQVLVNSGMRVGEANNLKRRDVTAFRDENQRLNYRFIVRGKTGEREVMLRSHVVKYVDLALEHGINKEPDSWLFCMGNGQKIKTLIDQFDIVLQSVGIVYDTKGFKFTLYSLRHYYAVDAIRRGIPVYEISRNIGTSLEMLQKYYEVAGFI